MDRLTRCFLSARNELLQFLTRRAGRNVAEDAVQDTWLRLHERSDPETWREPRAVLFTTAANLATDAHRRSLATDKVFTRVDAVEGPAAVGADPEARADALGRLERLAAALEQLPPACREAFLLNRLEGLSHAQIAARLGVSTKSVQRYIERALRACLEVPE
jgi:RNA polymerase sigma-70 factor (ECF subfamily)